VDNDALNGGLLLSSIDQAHRWGFVRRERMSVRIVLWVSGFLTLIAVGIPQLVGIGFWFLVVPGLILALAPTVFLYTATFAIVRRYLPITHAVALNLIAAFITLGLGVLVTLPVALAGWLAFNRAATGDVVPHNRVVIGGNVLLSSDETRTEYIAGKRQVPCDALCAALLDTPGVGTVTIAHTDSPTSYRLVPKGEAGSNAMRPTSPEQILQYLPAKPAPSDRRDYQAEMAARKARENAITARWGLLLANDVTLSMVPSPQHHDLTITLTLTGPRGSHEVAVKQVEVRDQEGRVLLRRQHVTATRLFVPLLVLPYDPFGSAKWGLARMDLATSDRLGDISAITALFDETTLARPSEPGDAVTSMVASIRDRLAAALMQPGAPADLSLANPWLATINWQSINDGDIELLGKLIADARVIDLPRLYEGATNSVRAEHRDAIVARLVNPATLPQLRNRLDTLVRFMPPGTFAVPTPDEFALLHNPLLRLNAPGLVQRLADQGKAGVPELVRILQEDVRAEPWATRKEVLAAVRRALIRLGPDAASALPAVIELFDQPDTPLANLSNEMTEWRVAMVRMGRPIGDVPFPPRYTVEQIAQLRSDLMRSVERARDHPDWRL
jgi:hypothetical protein